MKREYGVNLVDFYRGTLSVRLLGVYVRKLSGNSELVRELNGGEIPWSNEAHRLADLWQLWAKKDHPARAAIVEKARTLAKEARMVKKRADFEKKKRMYGM